MRGLTGEIRVLHVDDDAGIADLTKTYLERDDDRFTVETATSATEGLERLEADDVDCIVSDYEMPGTDGIEFLERVRTDYPDLPFIMFTGKGSETVASEAITNGATGYLQKDSGSDQYTLLANRIRNAVEQYRAKDRAADLDRIRTIVKDVNRTLVRAEDRETVEQEVCRKISDAEPYRFAWIADVDAETGKLEPRARAGVEEGYLDEVTVTAAEEPEGFGPGGRAYRERRIAVSQNVQEDPDFEPWREEALERGFQAVAAVPLEHEEAFYGLLGVYADRAQAFDEDERELLRELAADVAHALHSRELRRELRQERDRFRHLVNSVAEYAIHLLDPDGSVSSWNAGAERIYGYDRAEIRGEHYRRFFPDEAIETGRPDRLLSRADDEGTLETEGWRVRKDGSQFRASVSLTALYDESGSVRGYAKVTRDLSDRRERQRKIEALHEVATDIDTCETAADVYEMIVDAAESVLDFDIAIADAVDEDVLVPKAVSSDLSSERYYDETSIDADDNLAAIAYRTGDSSVMDDLTASDVVPADSEFRSALTVPIGDHGVFQAVAETPGAFDEADRELTELLVAHGRAQLSQLDRERQLRARTEDLRRQNERLDRFASVVSHDLRNPLNVAAAGVSQARRTGDSEALEDAAYAIDRMESLIDDLLTLARDGDEIGRLEAVDLPSLVEECWRTVGADGATLRTEIDRAVRADPDRLRQLLENLLQNAVEHGSTSPDSQARHDAAEQGGDVTIVLGEVGDGDGFYVADDGPGIPPDARDRVFEFGTSTSDGGTGFGLAIVNQIVAGHDWSIAATDSDDGGARFEITGVEFVDE